MGEHGYMTMQACNQSFTHGSSAGFVSLQNCAACAHCERALHCIKWICATMQMVNSSFGVAGKQHKGLNE